MRAYGMAQCPSIWYPSIRYQLFPLNYFFSRTTRPISTKLGRNEAWERGFRFVQIKGLAQKGAK